MWGSLVSFLGGAAFRAVWGEISSFIQAKQQHSFEIERMREQEKVDAATSDRRQAEIRLQHELGVETIRVQSVADLTKIDTNTFQLGVELTGKSTGIKLVDAWNGIIRPALATECMLLWNADLYRRNYALGDQDWALLFAALGLYLADRALSKRGK